MNTKIINIIKFTRVKDWLHFIFLPMLAIVPGAINWIDMSLSIVCAACCLGYGYGYNQYKDEYLDKNDDELSMELYGCKKNTLVLVLLILLIMALLISFIIARIAFFAAMVSLIGSTIYSGGPILKRIPVVGTLANLLIFVPVAFLGDGMAMGLDFFLFIFAFAGLLMQSQLIHEASHYKEDMRVRVYTTTAKFGLNYSKKYSLISGAIALLAFVMLAIRQESIWIWISISMLVLFDVLYWVYADFSNEIATTRLRLKQRYIGFIVGTVAYLVYFFNY